MSESAAGISLKASAGPFVATVVWRPRYFFVVVALFFLGSVGCCFFCGREKSTTMQKKKKPTNDHQTPVFMSKKMDEPFVFPEIFPRISNLHKKLSLRSFLKPFRAKVLLNA